MKVDGSRCGSPALTGKPKCHFHIQIFRRTKEFVLPPLEDANAIQVGVMEVMRALLEDRIERGKAGTLLYALQIAQSNLKSITLVAPAAPPAVDNEPSLAQILLKEMLAIDDEEKQDQKLQEYRKHLEQNPEEDFREQRVESGHGAGA
jgi:hypothetical protein